MRTFILWIIAVFWFSAGISQSPVREKKYPSLLWEITGKGMKKPSYLIGTMHVSSKMAFHLPDSFYIAVRNAQVVALETNPETWQEDMNRYDLSDEEDKGSYYENYTSMPSDYLSINTLKFFKYGNKIEKALYSSPSAINNLLYRTYGDERDDFEEDTYLDMYIFQCGKKWGKKISGVENYGESMRLMAEAYKDAQKDKTRKDRSYGDWDEAYSSDKLQDAYRVGNLDLLDSINKYNSISAAFDEKFLYRRNQIQANSIDSILRSGSSLFVGVGAAHLPGDRGVIELLRRMGYRLRPVKMGERASKEKDQVDKLRVQVVFHKEIADDGSYQVDIPGKFYKYWDKSTLDQVQYADMSNGSYYMVTRIMTNAWMWNHGPADVFKSIDSLLYENIPGKMISRNTISKNGYKGFDIVNRTRRGDLQRYNIFITPFDVIIFKMSGNGDYIKNGPEAEKFFGSIQLKEYRNETQAIAWKKYSPPYGGFAIDFPHDPYVGNDGSWIFDAVDNSAGIQCRVIRTDIYNFHFIEEDSFDLGLLDESFMASDFIKTQLSRRFLNYKGYPALDGSYQDHTGAVYLTRFILQGPHYYTIVVRGEKETPLMRQFLNSFEFIPYKYGGAKEQKDSLLYFSVKTPYYPEQKKIRLSIPRYSLFSSDDGESSDDIDDPGTGIYRNKIISNDSTGEKIYVSFIRLSNYFYAKDSSKLDLDSKVSFFADTGFIYKLRKKTTAPDRMRIWESIVTDSGSSRTLWTKVFYKDGMGFAIGTESDTLTGASEFVRSFFENFRPFDTLHGTDPFKRKSTLFFDDLASSDSLLHKRAIKKIDDIDIDSADLPRLRQAIDAISWKEKNYLDTKTKLINKLGSINTQASDLYLAQLYATFDDTVQLQYAVLENLLVHKTKASFGIFRDIIRNEPPVLEKSSSFHIPDIIAGLSKYYKTGLHNADGKFIDDLYDSLELTKTILPDLLPLLNLEDYKFFIMKLLSKMVDRGLIDNRDYESYYSKFWLEARQELKRQTIEEKKKAIEKAEEDKSDKKNTYFSTITTSKDAGNADLSLYATLLLPFAKTNPAVNGLIDQMLSSSDKLLKYNTLILLIKNEKPFPDTLLNYFASSDEYRYELYSDLKDEDKLSLFPATYNNHLALGKSALLNNKVYDKPDTVVYLSRSTASLKGKKGFVYFYKYKNKKDDLMWKLATVGLVPLDAGKFEFDDNLPFEVPDDLSDLFSPSFFKPYNLTSFTTTKIKDDEPLQAQLDKALKKLLYSRRKSAKEFYSDSQE